MIPRYTPKAFKEFWSPESQYKAWLKVEMAALFAMEEHGVCPKGTYEKVAERGVQIDVEYIEHIESTVRHDVVAFITYLEDILGDDSSWIHFGMTSSDVVDTANALQMGDAADILKENQIKLVGKVLDLAERHAGDLMMGRSHGQHAETTTFGYMLVGHADELSRGVERLQRASELIRVGKLSGAVGNYGVLPPEVEMLAMSRLRLRAEDVTTQVVGRDRYAEFVSQLALVAAGIERLALNIRHLARTEVGEVFEKFSKGQKGSSAMPHKKNPILCENLCGCSRIMRSYIAPSMESIALWHERDISHSSVERISIADSTSLLGYMQEKMMSVLDGLVVDTERMRKNLTLNQDATESEKALLFLVKKGMKRQDAYKIVQNCVQPSKKGIYYLLENLSSYLSSESIPFKYDAKELKEVFNEDSTSQRLNALTLRVVDRLR